MKNIKDKFGSNARHRERKILEEKTKKEFFGKKREDLEEVDR